MQYQPQIAVKEVGPEGQNKIKQAKVLIIGAGGLGVPLATYLAASGVGLIGILDGDKVSESNLSRQFAYSPKDVDSYKSEVLARSLEQQNPEITVRSMNAFLTEENGSFIKEYDIICDCTDNRESRILIDQLCFETSKPLVYAAVSNWEGYITILNARKKFRLNETFPHLASLDQNAGCSLTGIMNVTASVAAGIQGAEVLKIILGLEPNLDGRILCFDLLQNVFKDFKLNK